MAGCLRSEMSMSSASYNLVSFEAVSFSGVASPTLRLPGKSQDGKVGGGQSLLGSQLAWLGDQGLKGVKKRHAVGRCPAAPFVALESLSDRDGQYFQELYKN